MPVLYGTVVNGRIELPHPADLPDGTRVQIEAATPEPRAVGIAEEHWPTDPEGIAVLDARIAALEPWMTPEEDAAWRADMARRKAEQLAMWDKWTSEIERMFP